MPVFNFFRRNKSTNISETASSPETKEMPRIVDKKLFVEDQVPELETSTKKHNNPIEIFLGQNFEWQGYNDGYSYPETEYLETKLKVLKADFRLAVDKCLDVKRAEIGELRLHVIKTAGISPRLESQLKEKITLVEINIHELDMQKILSAGDEGFVCTAVHAYRLGFIKGIEKFQQEKLFAGSTGLFN